MHYGKSTPPPNNNQESLCKPMIRRKREMSLSTRASFAVQGCRAVLALLDEALPNYPRFLLPFSGRLCLTAGSLPGTLLCPDAAAYCSVCVLPQCLGWRC